MPECFHKIVIPFTGLWTSRIEDFLSDDDDGDQDPDDDDDDAGTGALGAKIIIISKKFKEQ